jgi:serine/threonine protein kinase
LANETLREGRYVILRPLGEGSQGTTFEAVDKREGRLVAVKRFSVRGARAWKDVELAEREARVLASLEHPQLPAYVEHFDEDGHLVLVMERIAGVSLAEFRRSGGRWQEADAIRFLEQASVVLGYLHGQTPPVIHRDLKPANILRRPDESFAFVDFGAVSNRLGTKGGSTVVGTFGYMAPEQFQGRAAPASDVYAVGATVVWMLTGVEPEDLPHKGLAIDVPGALGPRASPALVGVLSAMLEPDPEKRPKSIGPLLGGFAVRGRPVRPLSGDPPVRPPASRAEPRPQARVAPAPVAGHERGDFPADLLRTVRQFLPVFWIAAGVAWWALPRGTAMSFTIGVVIVSVVLRVYTPRVDRRFEKRHRRHYARTPAVRVSEAELRVAEAGEAEEPDEADAKAAVSHRKDVIS